MTYSATPLRLDLHREALARLWAENMSDATIAGVIDARLRWLYEDGPERRATTVLCVEKGSGAAVGCGSFFHRATWVDGRRVRSGVLCDFAVARAHRLGGAALVLQRALTAAAAAEGIELLYGHPNEKSLAIFKRIGYRVVGETTAWAKPLRSEPVLRGVLGAGAARLAALPLDAALRTFDGLRTAGSTPGLRGALLAPGDERVEALWRRARAQYAIVGEQSSEYLDWRYRRFPTVHCRIFGLSTAEDRRLVGIAVYAASGPKVSLFDFFADHIEHSAEPLLLRLAAHLRGEGAESLSLSYLGGPAFGKHLLAVGFLPRPARRPLVLYPQGLGAALSARAFDPDSWFMLEGELDI